MIYVYMNGYEFTLDLFELIHIFFPRDEIKHIESLEQYDGGYLIDFSLSNIGDALFGTTKVFFNEKIISKSKENIEDIFINKPKDKGLKIGVKKSLYNALIQITDKQFPWGVLTGIRPTKIVHELMDKNTDELTILNILKNEYLISADNAKLLMQIAKRQNPYIYPLNSDKYSLYIGIPFCPSRCIYCSFPALPIGRYKNMVDIYIDKLIYEISEIRKIMDGKNINTVYIGGGTPTAIPIQSLRRLIREVYKNFGKENINEFTIEAGRPDTINYELLSMLKEEEINRISINPQSMNDKTLKLIGRAHTSKDIIDSYLMTKDIGISCVNMDLIVGLPGEGVEEIKNTLNVIGELAPENLTVHTLSVKRGSNFKEHIGEYNIEDQRTIESMLMETKLFAKKMNLEPYYLYRQKNILGNFENVGYAKNGYECIYNISIMEEKESIVAAGVGSTSKVFYPEENRLERIFNFRDLNEYINRIDELIERKKKLFI